MAAAPSAVSRHPAPHGPAPLGGRAHAYRGWAAALAAVVVGMALSGIGLGIEVHDAQVRVGRIAVSYSPALAESPDPDQARSVGQTLRVASLWYSLHSPMPDASWAWDVESTPHGIHVAGPVALFTVIGLGDVYRWSPPPAIVPLGAGLGIGLGGLTAGAVLWQRRRPAGRPGAAYSWTMSAKRE